MDMPENVRRIIERLEDCGYEAYIVGGCVRDSICGRAPFDWDITTSALPEEALAALEKKNIIETGVKHGTVTVRYDNELYELTTFRTDGEYKDSRRPESVTFVKSLYEDLARRDFTINAMAYSDSAGLCDPFGGQSDLVAGIIRCVGDPDKRFGEDALRILRALRFASRLGFEIEKNTSDSIHKNAYLLERISAERISSELVQIIDGDFAEKVLLDYSDVLGVFIPEIMAMVGLEQFNPHHIYDVWEHTVKVVSNSPHGKVFRLAALFHDIGKPECFSLDSRGVGHFHGHPHISADMASSIMRRLRFDHKTISAVIPIIEFHDTRPPAEPKSIRRLLSKIGSEAFEGLLSIKRADILGQNPDTFAEKLAYVDELERIFREQTKNGEDYSLKTLAVRGKDLISIGITDGRTIGRILDHLLSMVIDGKAENDRDVLLGIAKDALKKS